MSSHRRASYGKRLAGVMLAAGLVMPAVQSDTPGPFGSDSRHARIRAHRNDDGTLKRGVRNEVETSNWSGYAIANFSTGTVYTGAKASWSVPKVSYKSPPPVCHTIEMRRSIHTICTSAFAEAEYSSSWVGIGGYCENASCTAVDNTLIQLGTEHDVSSRGATQYYAWVEVLPNYPILISPSYPYCQSLSCAYSVDPGDAITASLSCESNCSKPGQTQSWQLIMRNATKGWMFSTTVSYASTMLSPEWIQEAPSSSAGVLPLADFVTATFDPTVNAGSASNFPPGANGTVGPDAILMVDPYGETSAPSTAETSPSRGAFTTCWGNNPSSIASCPAP
jgi:Peptidase A4 family